MRLADPVTHERKVEFDAAANRIRVEDRLRCAAEHAVEQYWHFSETLDIALLDDRLIAKGAQISMALFWPAGGRARIERGARDPIAGWRSPSFGVLVPCTRLTIGIDIDGAWCGATTIVLAPSAQQLTSIAVPPR
jgi:hypothetical protein